MWIFAEKISQVQDVKLHESQPCDNIAITSWEQRYSTVLPHEIKDFYLAADGFKLTWTYNHAGEINAFCLSLETNFMSSFFQVNFFLWAKCSLTKSQTWNASPDWDTVSIQSSPLYWTWRWSTTGIKAAESFMHQSPSPIDSCRPRDQNWPRIPRRWLNLNSVCDGKCLNWTIAAETEEFVWYFRRNRIRLRWTINRLLLQIRFNWTV